MKLAICFVVCAATSLGAANVNFDDLKPGAPTGWNLTRTGKGEPKWTK